MMTIINEYEKEILKSIWVIAEFCGKNLSNINDTSEMFKKEHRLVYKKLRKKFDDLEPNTIDSTNPFSMTEGMNEWP